MLEGAPHRGQWNKVWRHNTTSKSHWILSIGELKKRKTKVTLRKREQMEELGPGVAEEEVELDICPLSQISGQWISVHGGQLHPLPPVPIGELWEPAGLRLESSEPELPLVWQSEPHAVSLGILGHPSPGVLQTQFIGHIWNLGRWGLAPYLLQLWQRATASGSLQSWGFT